MPPKFHAAFRSTIHEENSLNDGWICTEHTHARTLSRFYFSSPNSCIYIWSIEKKIALPAQKKIYRRYSFHLCYFWFVVVALIWSVKSLLDSFVCLQTVCAGCRISTVKLFTWVLQQEKRKLLLPFYNSLLLSSSSLFAYQQTTNLPHTHIYGGRNTTLGKLTACECVCVSLAQCMHKNTNKCRWARRCDILARRATASLAKLLITRKISL